ncbi:MAG: GSCFA domain-containing protein [Lentisphaerae bacterium]|jgi:hypothetical protein|nr:GSCFA domain-containing protein [Lentisphaerota bacterium]MBT4814949.1 GSCFA domain-containing protein [Lentisphaerota bacterium]MBT5604319.1 GSCFA domain-containing protein [Lentisphaerota bacterium]MBT7060270.1 GSCFA domain-containing protein [Lentisphaerota bacterium]MBT7847563.1 GSCFA domain-containing protein [Lentisphaerota bacterium]
MSTVKLTTPVGVSALDEPIALADQIVSVGSCFAQHMSSRLIENCFRVVANPYGILYNPASVSRCLRRVLDGSVFEPGGVFHHADLWQSFEFHGEFADPSREGAVGRMNTAHQHAAQALGTCDWLFVTFGTAFAWFHRGQPELAVANCHRLPAEQFERRLIPSGEIVADWGDLLDSLFAARPGMQVMMSVSPIRHLRQQAEENSVSKAHLLIAADELASSYPRVHRFPAYELVMDELRDYRFFERDLVHPNELAQEVIWERFRDACLAPEAAEFVAQLAGVRQALDHRPRNAAGDAHWQFLEHTRGRLEQLVARFPAADLASVRERLAGMARGGGEPRTP